MNTILKDNGGSMLKQAIPVPRPYKSTTHEEAFMHIVFPTTKDPDTGKVTGNDPRAVTVFLRKEDTGWHYALCRLNPIDQFCREQGRKHARRKYFVLRDTSLREESGVNCLPQPPLHDDGNINFSLLREGLTNRAILGDLHVDPEKGVQLLPYEKKVKNGA